MENFTDRMTVAAVQFNIQRQKYWIKHYIRENNPAAAQQAKEIIKALEKGSMAKGAAC